jgi:hypothetical protein
MPIERERDWLVETSLIADPTGDIFPARQKKHPYYQLRRAGESDSFRL